MAFCSKCGTETGGKFCPICGAPMPVAAPPVAAPVTPPAAAPFEAPAAPAAPSYAPPVYAPPTYAPPTYAPPTYAPPVANYAQPPYAASYAPPAPLAKKRSEGVLITALVFGSIALALCWVPIVSLMLAIPAVIMAIVGFIKAHPKKGLPLVAFIIAVAAMAASVIFNVAYVEEGIYTDDYYYDDYDYYDDDNYYDDYDYYT